jgi:hypothetical protein
MIGGFRRWTQAHAVGRPTSSSDRRSSRIVSRSQLDAALDMKTYVVPDVFEQHERELRESCHCMIEYKQEAVSMEDLGGTVSVPDKMTVYTEDRQWKADLKAWKNWLFAYQSIGAQADVYHRQETRDVWGHRKIDWVSASATIFISNTYKGSITEGVGSFVQFREINASHFELKEWAWGFLVFKITASGPSVQPAGAVLDINSVTSEIAVATGAARMGGTVAASSIFADNSAWG